jgi:hypothetical protein
MFGGAKETMGRLGFRQSVEGIPRLGNDWVFASEVLKLLEIRKTAT